MQYWYMLSFILSCCMIWSWSYVEWIRAPSKLTSSHGDDDNYTDRSDDEDSHYQFPIASSPYSSFTAEDNVHRRQMFYDQVSRYWPAVHDYVLVPDYAGIRPKLAPPSHAPHSHSTSASTYVGDNITPSWQATINVTDNGLSTSFSTATGTTSATTTITTTSTSDAIFLSSSYDHTYIVPSTSDFNICGRLQHGIPNLICLYGIESPGLTSSLAIGNYVRDILLAEKA